MPTETIAPPRLPGPSDGPVPPPAAPRSTRGRLARLGVPAALTGLALVSLWFRVRGLAIHYWVDEGISVGIAQHPLSQIPSLLRQDGSPPLYYVLLHLWMAVRGRSEIATHELSLIFAIATIPAAYWAGSSLFGRRAGAIGAVLAAGAPYITSYAQETRMYSLMALLSVILAASFVQSFVYRRRRYLPPFVAAMTAALYTHNWALFLGLITGATFLWCVWESPPEHRRALWRDGAIGFGAIALLYLPWLPTLVYQAKHTGAPWALPPVLWSLSQGMYFLVGGRGVAIALLLIGGIGLSAVRHDPASARAGVERAAKCLLALGLGTLLVAWVYAKLSPAWAFRYLAVIVGPLLLVVALGLSRAGRLGLVGLALVVSFWVLDPVQTSLHFKSNVANAVAAVRPDLTPGTLVVSTQPEQVPTLAYYMPRKVRFGTPLGMVPDPRVVDWRNALERFRRSSSASVLQRMLGSLTIGQRVALVVPASLPKAPLWMRLIHRASRKWTTILNHDPALVAVASSSAKATSTGVGVRVSVYESLR